MPRKKKKKSHMKNMIDLPANRYVFFESKPFEKDSRTLKVQIPEQEYSSVALWPLWVLENL